MAERKTRHARKALLIIDMMNKLDFPEAPQLLVRARPVARAIEKLRERFRKRDWPVIFVNDNFGDWRSDWKRIYETVVAEGCRGAELARRLKPEPEDYFVLKPKHSGFFSSPLEILLKELKVHELVLTGIAGNICVLFTAHDAYMRGFRIHVPRDCVASGTAREDAAALAQIEKVAGKVTTPSTRLRL